MILVGALETYISSALFLGIMLSQPNFHHLLCGCVRETERYRGETQNGFLCVAQTGLNFQSFCHGLYVQPHTPACPSLPFIFCCYFK